MSQCKRLKNCQKLLWRLIVAPEPPLKLPIRGDDRLSSAERLTIYSRMYFLRILDSLKEDFPLVLETLGDDPFHHLIANYLRTHFPTHWSLRYAGREFPNFLKTHPLTKKLPYLADLARFEYALLDSFDAADAEVLKKVDLALLKPEKWSETIFSP